MPTVSTRRRFIEILPVAGVALLAACSKVAETPPTPVAVPAPTPTTPPAPPPVATPAPVATPKVVAMVDEKSAQAMALGYVSDSSRADKVKYKNYVAGSQCSGCALYLGKADDAAAGCPLFPGKQVAGKGWCSSWAKKA